MHVKIHLEQKSPERVFSKQWAFGAAGSCFQDNGPPDQWALRPMGGPLNCWGFGTMSHRTNGMAPYTSQKHEGKAVGTKYQKINSLADNGLITLFCTATCYIEEKLWQVIWNVLRYTSSKFKVSPQLYKSYWDHTSTTSYKGITQHSGKYNFLVVS